MPRKSRWPPKALIRDRISDIGDELRDLYNQRFQVTDIDAIRTIDQEIRGLESEKKSAERSLRSRKKRRRR